MFYRIILDIAFPHEFSQQALEARLAGLCQQSINVKVGEAVILQSNWSLHLCPHSTKPAPPCTSLVEWKLPLEE